MFDPPEILRMAQSMSRHAALRQEAVASNIANADTPGYRARDVAPFAEVYSEGSGLQLRETRAGHVAGSASDQAGAISTRPGGANLSPDGNSVSLETEMVEADAVRRQNDLALAIYRSSLGILRNALGRT